jgi:hypothetical protein
MCKPRQSFTPELTVCILLIFGVIGAWTGFFLFFDHSAGERAAFWFMRNHLSLGEPPDFVLHIAGQGMPQRYAPTRRNLDHLEGVATQSGHGLDVDRRFNLVSLPTVES